MATTFDTLKFVTKSDLRVAVAEIRADIIKWMVGLALAQIGLLIGILLKLSGH